MRQIPHTFDKGRIVIFVIDIALESGARGRKQTIIMRIFNRDDKILLFKFSMLYRT